MYLASSIKAVSINTRKKKAEEKCLPNTWNIKIQYSTFVLL